MSAPTTTNPQTYWTSQLGLPNLEKLTYMSTPAQFAISEDTGSTVVSTAALTSIKRIAQSTNQNNGFEYWLGFTVQTNWKTAPAATNYLAQWWAPKWNAAAVDGYTAYVCHENANGTTPSA